MYIRRFNGPAFASHKVGLRASWEAFCSLNREEKGANDALEVNYDAARGKCPESRRFDGVFLLNLIAPHFRSR